jgi:hypothetical protein
MCRATKMKVPDDAIMSDKLYQVPLSFGALALDQLAYENWLGGIDPPSPGPIPHNPELERRVSQDREQWAKRASDRDRLATADLNVRLLKQRLAREGSPLLRKALMDEAEKVRRLARGMFHHGSPCSKCGMTLRYNANNNCVTCNHRPINPVRQARRLAIDAGSARMIGSPCKKCGVRLRYTRNGHCVRCDTERQRVKKQQQQVKRKKIA